MSDGLSLMPANLLRQWLSTIVEKVVVDMETKSIEIRLMIPKGLLEESALLAQNPMRLVQTSASSPVYETHPLVGRMTIAVIDCVFKKASNQICYDCHRRAA